MMNSASGRWPKSSDASQPKRLMSRALGDLGELLLGTTGERLKSRVSVAQRPRAARLQGVALARPADFARLWRTNFGRDETALFETSERGVDRTGRHVAAGAYLDFVVDGDAA